MVAWTGMMEGEDGEKIKQDWIDIYKVHEFY